MAEVQRSQFNTHRGVASVLPGLASRSTPTGASLLKNVFVTGIPGTRSLWDVAALRGDGAGRPRPPAPTRWDGAGLGGPGG
jgi:hypothetical protein